MKQPLLTNVRRGRLWEPGHRVAVAVSGGADSVALAHLLQQTRGLHGAELSLVHVDHGWRATSHAWADLVQRLGERLQLPVTVERVTCARDEAAAREARYAVFAALDVDRVALAHHQQDQAETVLINLLRGGRGVRGMRPRRDRYVRPLLDQVPGALRQWCEQHDLAFVDDPSNHDERYLRTRVRGLLPTLEAIRPGSSAAIARTATRQAEDDALLEALAADLPLTTGSLAAAPRVLARRRLRQALEPITAGPLEALLDAIEKGEGTVQLDTDRRIRVTADRIDLGG